jgi:tetratricopeptide (TPR) repeat protein
VGCGTVAESLIPIRPLRQTVGVHATNNRPSSSSLDHARRRMLAASVKVNQADMSSMQRYAPQEQRTVAAASLIAGGFDVSFRDFQAWGGASTTARPPLPLSSTMTGSQAREENFNASTSLTRRRAGAGGGGDADATQRLGGSASDPNAVSGNRWFLGPDAAGGASARSPSPKGPLSTTQLAATATLTSTRSPARVLVEDAMHRAVFNQRVGTLAPSRAVTPAPVLSPEPAVGGGGSGRFEDPTDPVAAAAAAGRRASLTKSPSTSPGQRRLSDPKQQQPQRDGLLGTSDVVHDTSSFEATASVRDKSGAPRPPGKMATTGGGATRFEAKQADQQRQKAAANRVEKAREETAEMIRKGMQAFRANRIGDASDLLSKAIKQEILLDPFGLPVQQSLMALGHCHLRMLRHDDAAYFFGCAIDVSQRASASRAHSADLATEACQALLDAQQYDDAVKEGLRALRWAKEVALSGVDKAQLVLHRTKSAVQSNTLKEPKLSVTLSAPPAANPLASPLPPPRLPSEALTADDTAPQTEKQPGTPEPSTVEKPFASNPPSREPSRSATPRSTPLQQSQQELPTFQKLIYSTRLSPAGISNLLAVANVERIVGTAYSLSGHAEAAQELLDEAVAIAGKFAPKGLDAVRAYRDRGLHALVCLQPTRANESLIQAALIAEHNSNTKNHMRDVVLVYEGLGDAYTALNEPLRAVVEYEKAISLLERTAPLHPDFLLLATKLLQASCTIRNPAAAKGYFDKAVKIDPLFKWLYQARALLHMQRGEYDDAYSFFYNALECDPTFAEARYCRLILLRRMIAAKHSAATNVDLVTEIAEAKELDVEESAHFAAAKTGELYRVLHANRLTGRVRLPESTLRTQDQYDAALDDLLTQVQNDSLSEATLRRTLTDFGITQNYDSQVKVEFDPTERMTVPRIAAALDGEIARIDKLLDDDATVRLKRITASSCPPPPPPPLGAEEAGRGGLHVPGEAGDSPLMPNLPPLGGQLAEDAHHDALLGVNAELTRAESRMHSTMSSMHEPLSADARRKLNLEKLEIVMLQQNLLPVLQEGDASRADEAASAVANYVVALTSELHLLFRAYLIWQPDSAVIETVPPLLIDGADEEKSDGSLSQTPSATPPGTPTSTFGQRVHPANPTPKNAVDIPEQDGGEELVHMTPRSAAKVSFRTKVPAVRRGSTGGAPGSRRGSAMIPNSPQEAESSVEQPPESKLLGRRRSARRASWVGAVENYQSGDGDGGDDDHQHRPIERRSSSMNMGSARHRRGSFSAMSSKSRENLGLTTTLPGETEPALVGEAAEQSVAHQYLSSFIACAPVYGMYVAQFLNQGVTHITAPPALFHDNAGELLDGYLDDVCVGPRVRSLQHLHRLRQLHVTLETAQAVAVRVAADILAMTQSQVEELSPNPLDNLASHFSVRDSIKVNFRTVSEREKRGLQLFFADNADHPSALGRCHAWGYVSRLVQNPTFADSAEDALEKLKGTSESRYDQQRSEAGLRVVATVRQVFCDATRDAHREERLAKKTAKREEAERQEEAERIRRDRDIGLDGPNCGCRACVVM